MCPDSAEQPAIQPKAMRKNRFAKRTGFAKKKGFSAYAEKDHKIRFCLNYTLGANVLDLGCVQHNPDNYRSKYWLHKALAANARAVTGLDYDKTGVEQLQRFGFNITYGDACNFVMEDKYDVIVAGDIIEHLTNFDGFFKSCSMNLTDNGVILVSTPNPWYWRHIVKAAFLSRVTNNSEHTCWFDPVTLSQLAGRYGFFVEEIRYGSRYLKDRVLPLPKGIKHTSFHACLRRRS